MSTHIRSVRGLLVATSAVLALGVAGCSAFAPASAPQSAPMDRSGGAEAPAQDRSRPEEGGPTADRQIVRTGSIVVQVDDVLGTADRLHQLVLTFDGFVSSEAITTNSDTSTATSRIVFSVPADRMEAFMAEAAKVGVLKNRNVTAKDVTGQVVEVEARIITLRESITRIRALMERAGSVTQIAEIEAELTRRQSDLEALLAQQKALKNQVERAPVTVTLLKPGQTDEPANPFLAGLLAGWNALGQSTTALLAIIGALIPFAALASLIVFPLLAWRRRRAAARMKATGNAPKPQPSADPEPSGKQAAPSGTGADE